MLKSMNAPFQLFISDKKRILGQLIMISASISLFGCKTLNYSILNQDIDRHMNSRAANDYFQGLLIYDPVKNDTLYSYNSQKYFTPASNTKIFTLYTSLKTLPEKIPALKYIVKNDTLYMEGTGDPTLLHSYFGDSTAIKLAQNHKNISLYLNNFKESRYGPGWAWEDYDLYFSPERNSIPLYGNVVTITNNGSLLVSPEHFKDQVVPIGYGVNREL